jgi:chemotaxis protein MotB
MSARGGRRRSSNHHEGEHENEERWLLTYADMITLLMTLFMVLFAISSVNTAKFEALKNSLAEAVSGKIVSGGTNIQETGATDQTSQSAPEPPIPAIKPVVDVKSSTSTAATATASATPSSAAAHEEEDFKDLKRKIDAYAKEHGLQSKLQSAVVRRGLVIRLLTDKVLYNSGSATLNPSATPLLDRISSLLRTEFDHPIVVEGHTDDQAIASAQFPTNWELSTARATAVVRFLIRDHVGPGRLGAAGYGAMHPLTTNATAAGRSRNRRVEIVLTRQH